MQPLDQLKQEFDRTLENIGRLFASTTNGNKSGAYAQSARLKGQFPASINNFHEALDQLEDELQLARAVMRRDLAVLRKQSILPPDPVQREATKPVPSAQNGDAGANIPMVEPKPSEPEDHDGVKMQSDEAAPESDGEPTANTAADESKSAPETKDVEAAREDLPKEPTPAPQSGEGKPPDLALQLKINDDTERDLFNDTGDAMEDDKPPDTATMSDTRDLDSLFNDPVSAGGAVVTTEENAEPDFTSGFDFGTFNGGLDNNAADNDNIEGLLPGLQDYANTHPASTTDPDFDALFATNPPADGQGQGSNGQQQGTDEQRDTTFDDIMNFADFNGGDYGNGGQGGGDNNEEFDFNFD